MADESGTDILPVDTAAVIGDSYIAYTAVFNFNGGLNVFSGVEIT